MHVVIIFPRVVQRHSTWKMKLKILSQKSQNFFLCCKFARVIIKREGGPKSFCPTCQELSKNLLQFFSLSLLSISQKLEGQEKSSHRIHDVLRSWGEKLKIDSNWQVRVLTLCRKFAFVTWVNGRHHFLHPKYVDFGAKSLEFCDLWLLHFSFLKGFFWLCRMQSSKLSSHMWPYFTTQEKR